MTGLIGGTPELSPFPDAEAVCVALLGDIAETGTRTPPNLGEDEVDPASAEAAPYIRAVRTGGGDDGVTDRPVMAVTVYALTRAQAWDLTRTRVQPRVLAAGGGAVQVDPDPDQAPVLIDRTQTYTGPLENPDQNPNIRSATTYYVMEFRRPSR